MNATVDLVLERRRQRRRLAFWRIVAIVLAVVAVVLMLKPHQSNVGLSRDYIARLSVEGIIFDDPERDEALAQIANDKAAKALIVRIDSPGGTVVGSEALYENLRKVAAQKPVVAVMAETAASGGYITALAADHIIARGNTLTGSIGVLAEIPNISGLMQKIGVEMTRVKSAPLKAEPSFTNPPSPEALAAQSDLIEDSYVWFKDLVTQRRHLEGAKLDQVADGRAFTGRQALALGLIDAIGDQDNALAWLGDAHDLGPDLPVVEIEWGESQLPWPLDGLDQNEGAMALIQRFTGEGMGLFALIQ